MSVTDNYSGRVPRTIDGRCRWKAMPERPTAAWPFVVAVFLLLPISTAYAQARKPRVSLKVDTDHYEIVDGKKGYLSSFNLYSVVNGRRHFIVRLYHMIVPIPEPIVDPTGRYIFYAGNRGCGFENEGQTVFVADVYGKRKAPILGKCWYLRPERFVRGNGRTFLLITGESESPEKDFWLYDINAAKIILHADGAIREIGKGRFAYGQYDDAGAFKPLGTVTTATLIRGGPPLRRWGDREKGRRGMRETGKRPAAKRTGD